jgi:transcriptional regulator with XRE-family HTH domain
MGKKTKKKKKARSKVHFAMSLKHLRKARGLRQSDIGSFEQTSVSKIEGRKDLKISTLIDYLDALDLDLEVRAVSRNAEGETQRDEYLLIGPEIVETSPDESEEGPSLAE